MYDGPHTQNQVPSTKTLISITVDRSGSMESMQGETAKALTTFIKGSYNTFDTGIVSDASLLPGANGKFDLYVPQDFGTFIGYSYVIDWEEYQ